MRLQRFILISLIMIVIQAGILNFVDFSQFISILFAPSIILCLPLSMSTSVVLILSFVIGYLIDFCSNGIMGLTICALLPVAMLRKPIITLVCGEEVFSRGENISYSRQGLAKIAITLTLLTALFLFVYIAADGAGTRPFWFNLVRFILSLIVSTLVGLAVVNVLSEKH